jgi:VWFA-related protein
MARTYSLACTWLVVSGLALGVAVSAQTQQFVLSSQDRAKLITVDFAAVGADGLPVGDLQPSDVTLRIDGRTRTIRSLEYVPVRASAGMAGALPYGSNVATEDGRAIVLIVDFESIRPGRESALREHIGQFVRTLSPNDRLALVTVPYGGVKVDLTTDHAKVSQSLAALSGQAPSVESESEAACRTRATLVALRGAIDDLRGAEAPVTVVLFSGQMAGPQGVQAMQSGVSLGRCQLLREHFQQVGSAVANARAQLYIVQPELSSSSAGLAGLEHLTGVTGAPLWHISGTTDGALARVLRETGGYYLARFEPEPEETQGSVRGLSINISRPGVVLRSRPQMTVVRPQTRFAGTAPATPLAMMKEARLFRDLPLRVAGFSSREPGERNVRVVVLFDSPDPAAALTDAIVGLFSEDGKLVSSRVMPAAELVGSTVTTALTVPAGRYRLRVAASEASGRGGTADFMLDAGLVSAGGLTLSDLVLGLSRDGQFQPRLEFGAQATAMAHLEIYGGREGARVGVMFEIARTMNGPAIVTMPGAFAPTNESDRFLVTAAIPIGALPPGDYVVRATVAAQDQAGGRVVRPLRKVAR